MKQGGGFEGYCNSKYMPWVVGKTPCTHGAHILRFFWFFDKYKCEYILK
jgi:hypothetical protein